MQIVEREPREIVANYVLEERRKRMASKTKIKMKERKRWRIIQSLDQRYIVDRRDQIGKGAIVDRVAFCVYFCV